MRALGWLAAATVCVLGLLLAWALGAALVEAGRARGVDLEWVSMCLGVIIGQLTFWAALAARGAFDAD